MVAENPVHHPPPGSALIDRIIAGDEQPIDAREAACLPELCRGGRPVAVGLVYRWGRRGCNGHVLESAMVGGTWVTTRPAVARFLQQINNGRQSGAGANTPRRQSAVARQAHARALVELSRAGLSMGATR